MCTVEQVHDANRCSTDFHSHCDMFLQVEVRVGQCHVERFMNRSVDNWVHVTKLTSMCRVGRDPFQREDDCILKRSDLLVFTAYAYGFATASWCLFTLIAKHVLFPP